MGLNCCIMDSYIRASMRQHKGTSHPYVNVLHEKYGESCHHNANHRHELDEDVEGRTRGVFERITNSVTNNGGLVSKGAFTSKVAFFDHLLGIIPSSTSICHKDSEREATGESTDQQTKDTSNTQYATCYNRYSNGKE